MDLIWLDGRLVVAGPDTRAWKRADGEIDSGIEEFDGPPIVGLRFPSGVLPFLLGVPAAELRNTRLLLVELMGKGATDRYESRAARGDPAGVLLQFAERSLAEGDPVEQMRQVSMMCARGRSVADIVSATGWSERTLHRRCLTAFGYGAKTLERVLRFRRATAMIASGRALADVAAQLGYADQAHLSRAVKEFSGRSPATFRSIDQAGRAEITVDAGPARR